MVSCYWSLFRGVYETWQRLLFSVFEVFVVLTLIMLFLAWAVRSCCSNSDQKGILTLEHNIAIPAVKHIPLLKDILVVLFPQNGDAYGPCLASEMH